MNKEKDAQFCDFSKSKCPFDTLGKPCKKFSVKDYFLRAFVMTKPMKGPIKGFTWLYIPIAC